VDGPQCLSYVWDSLILSWSAVFPWLSIDWFGFGSAFLARVLLVFEDRFGIATDAGALNVTYAAVYFDGGFALGRDGCGFGTKGFVGVLPPTFGAYYIIESSEVRRELPTPIAVSGKSSQ